MSAGESPPPVNEPTGDNDGDGVNNATEVAIDSGARYQSDADADQAESELVRSERREAYTDFLTAYNNAAIDLLGAAGTFATPGVSPKALAQQEQKAVDAVKDVTSTYFNDKDKKQNS
jgi:hypothetical protein